MWAKDTSELNFNSFQRKKNKQDIGHKQMMIIQSESILPILRTLIKTEIIHNKNSEDIPCMATTGECILAGNI